MKTSKDINKLKRIYKSLSKDTQEYTNRLIKNLVFMDSTLDELMKRIKDEGSVIITTNGNGFETYTEHPAQKQYTSLIPRYNQTLKILIDLVPKETDADAFTEWTK